MPLIAVLALGYASVQQAAQIPAASGQSVTNGAERYVESLPGVRTGVVNSEQRRINTAVVNRALVQGAVLRLRAGARLEIASSLRIGSGGGLIGDGNGAKPTIFMPASAFTNTNDVADQGRYGSNAVGINFSGELSGQRRPSSGVRIENIRLLSEERRGRRLRGIVGQNVAGCVISDVEISGLPLGIGLALASARGCRVTGVHVHDFADDTAWAQLPQSTGIEIDNDIIAGRPSSDLVIERFKVERLLVEGPLLAKWGYQTDGINIMNSGSRVQVRSGRVSDVGEGIDTFGSGGTISNVEIDNAFIFGLKFVHGASRNVVTNVVIRNAGLAGVNFSGSDQAAQDTADNVINSITITNIDPAGMWKENSSAGILVSGRNARRVPVRNRVINAIIDVGPNGKYGWVDQSTGSGNSGEGIRIRGGSKLDRRVLVLYGGGAVREGPSN